MPDPNFTSRDDLVSVVTDQDLAAATDDQKRKHLVQNKDIIDDHLAFAESRVESYLVDYDLSEVRNNAPPAVVWAVLFVAAYSLYQRSDLQTSTEVSEAYNEALNWLMDVRAGEATIPGLSAYDKSFVGFGDTSTMIIDRVPHSDSIPTV